MGEELEQRIYSEVKSDEVTRYAPITLNYDVSNVLRVKLP
jgi:hypothetical protein